VGAAVAARRMQRGGAIGARLVSVCAKVGHERGDARDVTLLRRAKERHHLRAPEPIRRGALPMQRHEAAGVAGRGGAAHRQCLRVRVVEGGVAAAARVARHGRVRVVSRRRRRGRIVARGHGWEIYLREHITEVDESVQRAPNPARKAMTC